MDKIGFGNQPYLVYQHLDAGNPHIHIVTTNIQNNGKRISLHNIGKNQSVQARKEIKIAFKPIKAEDQKKIRRNQTIRYTSFDLGEISKKKGITTVLDTIPPKYIYSNRTFNSLIETFQQEERFLTQEYSINLPATHNLKGRSSKSRIIINPFRGIGLFSYVDILMTSGFRKTDDTEDGEISPGIDLRTTIPQECTNSHKFTFFFKIGN
jgi:hypothetical protein